MIDPAIAALIAFLAILAAMFALGYFFGWQRQERVVIARMVAQHEHTRKVLYDEVDGILSALRGMEDRLLPHSAETVAEQAVQDVQQV